MNEQSISAIDKKKNELVSWDRIPYTEEWKANLRFINGKLEARSPFNGYQYLKNHREVRLRLIYDEFSDRHLVIGPLPWDKSESFRVRRISDNDAFRAMLWLEQQGIKMYKNNVADALSAAAEENRINPAKIYFENLANDPQRKWDEKPRLATWLQTYLGAREQPKQYLKAVGVKWMIAVVSRSFKPGTKFDHTLILEGGQGIGKSTALRELATFDGETYFYDGRVSFNDKDTLMAVQGKIIIEMAELASFKKSENEEIKSFSTRTTDEYRDPYGRQMKERPRYFVLTGSTNQREYLPPDESGHRRAWPVRCGQINLELLKTDREQLWAEAVHLYLSGTPSYVLPKEIHLFEEEQNKRVMVDAWFDLIALRLNATTSEQTIDALFESIGMEASRRDNRARHRMKSVLDQLGWEEGKATDGSHRVWRKKEIKSINLTDGEQV